MTSKKARLGEILVRAGVVSEAQVEKALQRQKATGGTLGRQLVALGYVGYEDLGQALARQHGVPFVELEGRDYDTSLLDFIPDQMIRDNFILPVKVDEYSIFILMPDPSNEPVIDELFFITGRKVRVSVASEELLERFIEGALAARDRGESTYFFPGSVERRDAAPPPFEGLSSNGVPDPAPAAPGEIPLSLEELDEPEGAGPGKKQVLVVDDEYPIRKFLNDFLKRKGYEVSGAEDGYEAIRLLKEKRFDLILLDCMLPGIHGFEICQRLKSSRKFKDIPLIMVSAVYKGWETEADLKRQYGVDGFVQKPFSVSVLEKKLSSVESLKSDHDRAREKAERQAARQAIAEGVRRYRARDWAGAREVLVEALRYDELYPEIHYYLGDIHERLERRYEALDHYEKAVQLRPDFFEALKRLAMLYEKLGFQNKAVDLWQRAARAAEDESVRSRIKAHLLELI